MSELIPDTSMLEIAKRRLAGAAIFLSKKLHKKENRQKKPLVSIIVPFYNVEKYIDECLASLLNQTYSNLEVILVDDGSPDSSRDVAISYVEKDSRFKLVTRENGGLGAARNTGLEYAVGDYLVFVDSDDLLPKNSISALVNRAEIDGSDICVGKLQRFNSTRQWYPEWIDRTHGESKKIEKVEEHLELLRNNYSHSKVFRRDFFVDAGAKFRENCSYEDQPLITELYLKASNISVLTDVVYEYRERDDKSSISQQTGTIKDLKDRIEAWDETIKVLKGHDRPEVLCEWFRTIFETHVHWYVNNDAISNDEYYKILSKAIKSYVETSPARSLDIIPPHRLTPIGLILEDRLDDLQNFRNGSYYKLGQIPYTINNGLLTVNLPKNFENQLTTLRCVMPNDRISVRHEIRQAFWSIDQRNEPSFVMKGYVLVEALADQKEISKRLLQIRTGSGEVLIEKNMLLTEEEDLVPPGATKAVSYSYSPFIVEFNASDFDLIANSFTDGQRLDLWFAIELPSHTLFERVRNVARWGTASSTGVCRVSNSWRVALVSSGDGLQFSTSKIYSSLKELRLTNHETAIWLNENTEQFDRIEIKNLQNGQVKVLRKMNDLSFAVANDGLDVISDSDVSKINWEVRAVKNNGRRVPISLGPVLPAEIENTAIRAVRTKKGNLGFVSETSFFTVNEIDTIGALKVRLKMRFYGIDDGNCWSLYLQSALGRSVTVDVFPEDINDGVFHIVLPLEELRFGEMLPLRQGGWNFVAEKRLPDASFKKVKVKVSEGLLSSLPKRINGSRSLFLVLRSLSGTLHISSRKGLSLEERGAFNQSLIREKAFSAKLPLRDQFLFRSYFGESVNCNGLAVANELLRRGFKGKIFAGVQDESVFVPEGIEPILIGSQSWFEQLASSRWYMDNMYQPDYHEKPLGQVIVQTFHGYPFKLMGKALWHREASSQFRIDEYKRRSQDWDFLVSPAPYATPMLREQFFFEGEVIEAGYPRNDQLFSVSEQEKRVIRSRIGVPQDKTIVFYAPTFRDYLSLDGHTAQFKDFIEAERLAVELGEEFQVVVRGHAFNARKKIDVSSSRVVDVTYYWDVQDLLKISDLAIFDYSSIRFDYAVTKKPMIFYVPDYEEYIGSRGWLLPFEETAPGPIVHEYEDLVSTIFDYRNWSLEYSRSIQAFYDSFTPLEDGHSAARVVERLFIGRPELF